MPSRDRKENIISKQEAFLLRSSQAMVSQIPKFTRYGQPEPNFQVFSNLPVSALVKDWDNYARDKVPGLWGVTESELLPSQIVVWNGKHEPLFQWKKVDDREVAIWRFGYYRGDPIYQTKDSRAQNVNHWRKERWFDRSARPLFDALDNAQSEDEFHSLLNRYYPRVESSLYEERLGKIFSSSLDMVVARDTANLATSPEDSQISPHCAWEYDGITGATVVNGEIRWSEHYVGEDFGYRDNRGAVNRDMVENRLQKLNDKIRILDDLCIPSTVLSYDSLIWVPIPNNPRGMLAADISLYHLINVGHLMRDDWPELPSNVRDKNSVTELLATKSFGGTQYSTLKSQSILDCVKIERVDDIAFDENVGEDDSTGWIIHREVTEERRKRLGFDSIGALEELGVDPSNMSGIQISTEHPRINGPRVVRIPLWPTLFSGSITYPEYDHLMLAGAASDILLGIINNEILGIDRRSTLSGNL